MVKYYDGTYVYIEGDNTMEENNTEGLDAVGHNIADTESKFLSLPWTYATLSPLVPKSAALRPAVAWLRQAFLVPPQQLTCHNVADANSKS